MKKAALVTGGNRGIGQAISLELAKLGIPVMINYHNNLKSAQSTFEAIREMGGEASIFQADVSNQQCVKEMLVKIKSQGYWIHTLVNNAGIVRDKILATLTSNDWRDVVATNLDSCFYCIREAVSTMIARKSGQIVNITSVSGFRGQIGQTNYSASKGGIIALTRSLAREVGRFNIRVNAVAPGFIQTDMISQLESNHTPNTLETIKTHIPLSRFGKAEEVAKVVSFLCSPSASYISGQVLVVDGGLSA
jgi:3-oxoacyl-[acyl-carrier protein] reductase